jgi:predicted lactoylglutathione lyase
VKRRERELLAALTVDVAPDVDVERALEHGAKAVRETIPIASVR